MTDGKDEHMLHMLLKALTENIKLKAEFIKLRKKHLALQAKNQKLRESLNLGNDNKQRPTQQ
jgi:hypothetical protein